MLGLCVKVVLYTKQDPLFYLKKCSICRFYSCSDEKSLDLFTIFGNIFRQQNYMSFNPLLEDKILNWSKLKDIADDILKCIKMKNESAIKGRKYCEKRRNCLLQAISPFLTIFSTAITL